MRWLFAKIDSLAGTVFAAVAGILTSQFLAFIQQYRQRLGGHLAEAQLAARQTRDAQSNLLDPAQADLLQAMQDRVTALADAAGAIASAGPLALPRVFLFNFDADIVFGTLHDFRPALPLDATSLLYGVIGIILGWALYGWIKAPFRRLLRGRA